MSKEPLTARPSTRYEPYHATLLAHRRQGSPPSGNWGNRASTRSYQLNGRIYAFLEDLHTHYGGHELRELFREHARQTGALGEAIETWLQYDEVSRLPTSFLWTAPDQRAVG
jgi:hypothetical protein